MPSLQRRALSGPHLAPAGLALLAAFLFGASTPASKLLLGELEPFALAGLLYLGAALLLAAIMLGGGPGGGGLWLPRDRHNRMRLLGSVVCGGVLGPVLLLYGLRAASAASVSIWLNLETVATALLAVLFFREQLSRLTWLANGGVCLAGVLLSLGEGWSGLTPGLLVAAACLCWGLDNNLTSLIDGITPAKATLWKGLVAGGMNLGIGLTLGAPPPALAAGEALVLGGLAYGGSITLYITAAQRLGASRSQTIFASSPFFGLALALAFLREQLTLWQAAAALVLVASLWLMFREEHDHEHVHEAGTHAHGHEHADEHHAHEHPDEKTMGRASAWHVHHRVVHRHPHWPDLHHRHQHERRGAEPPA